MAQPTPWPLVRSSIDGMWREPADRIIAARDLINELEAYICEQEAQPRSVAIAVPPAALDMKGGQ
jgi:hypothetical protein